MSAVVANSDCLCSSDCESREVLTLLCQGKMWAQICTHSVWHTGHTVIWLHLSPSSTYWACLSHMLFLLFPPLTHTFILSGMVSPLISAYLTFTYFIILIFHSSSLDIIILSFLCLVCSLHFTQTVNVYCSISFLCPWQTVAGVVLQLTV